MKIAVRNNNVLRQDLASKKQDFEKQSAMLKEIKDDLQKKNIWNEELSEKLNDKLKTDERLETTLKYLANLNESNDKLTQQNIEIKNKEENMRKKYEDSVLDL